MSISHRLQSAAAMTAVIWLSLGALVAADFRRGDVNADGTSNLSDAVFSLGHLYLGTEPPSCLKAADTNDDGRINISDPIFLLNYLFLGGEAPQNPGPTVCGPDPTPDALDCAIYLPANQALRCGGNPPSITDLSAPRSIPLGGEAEVRFAYQDPDADIALLRVESSSSGSSAGPAGLLGIAGQSGVGVLRLKARDLPFASPVRFVLRLEDRSGLESSPVEFTILVEGAAVGGTPPALSLLTPDASAWNRPAGSADLCRPAIRVEYSDPDGDLERLRIRLTVPGGESVTAEEEAASLRMTGASGIVVLRFLEFRSTSAMGHHKVELTPLDRNGNTGDTVTVGIELTGSGGEEPLAIHGFTPESGPEGTEVVLDGAGFDAAAPERNVVEMAERPVEVRAATETTLTVVIPPDAITAPFVVRAENGIALSDGSFVVPSSVEISPTEASIPVGKTLPFNARVTSAPDGSVAWFVSGIEGGIPTAGTITPAGVYSAPAGVPPGGAVTIEARLASDPSVRASATVEIVPPTSWPGSSRVLAAAGGLVASTDGRAAVMIPPGALPSDSIISLAAVPAAVSPPPPPGLLIAGGVEWQPSPLLFQEPVLVTIPLYRYHRPGTELPLRFYQAGGVFADEGILATVTQSGEQASASISHFSTAFILEPAPLPEQGNEPIVLVITGITPMEAEEGLRVPILVTGTYLDGNLDRVEVLRESGEPTEDIVAGTIYPVGDRAGVLLSIGSIQDLPEGARRTYRLLFHRIGSLRPAETAFDVIGLDELIVPLAENVALSGTATRRYSLVSVGGVLHLPPGGIKIESTGPVTVLGTIEGAGSPGASAPGWTCGGLTGDDPALCGQGGPRDGRGGLGRERETLGEVSGEALSAILSHAIPLVGGALGSLAREILDSPDAEHEGAHAPTCASVLIEGCSRSTLPRGVGGRSGASIDLEEIRQEAATLIRHCIECAEALIAGNPLEFGVCESIRGDVETLLVTFIAISEGPTGRRGFGSVPQGQGGGGGGGGRFKTIAFPVPTFGDFALAIDGGGGGSGGLPGRPLEIVSAGEIELLDPFGLAELDELADLVSSFGPAQAILQQIPRGKILTRGGEGGSGSEKGRVTIITNNPLIKPILDLIPWPAVDAFGGGGGGGGAGARVVLLAARGIRSSNDAAGHIDTQGGAGGLGGSTVIDPGNAHIQVRQERSELSRGSRGSIVLNRGEHTFAFRPLDEEGRIESGNFVTNRSVLLVRFKAASHDPLPVVVEGESGEEHTATSSYNASSGYHHARVVLFEGFNRIAGGHELLDLKILSVFEDSDGDGLSDADEVYLRLDPTNPDTDGDGYTDGAEVTLGSNPRNPDGDNDGLPDPVEFALGTSPTSADSDGDGVHDGAEVLLSSDPLSAASMPPAIPSGTLLAASTLGNLSVLDPTTGRTGVLGKAAGGLGFGLAFDRAGNLLIASFTRLTRVNPLGADVLGHLAETLIGNFEAPDGAAIRVSQIAYHPGDRVLYGVELGPGPDFLETGQLVSISPETAEAVRVGPPGARALHALVVDRDGRLLASIAEDETTDRLVVIDRAAGAIAEDRGAIGFAPVFGLAFDRKDVLWATAIRATIEGRLLTIEPGTGRGSHVADVDRALFGLTFAPCPPPCGSLADLYPVAAGPVAIAALDLDGDGRPEVVTTNALALSILHNQGDGSYAPAVDVPVPGQFANQLTVSDLDGDGRPDLVAATVGAGRPTVTLFKNQGNGTLGTPLTSSVSSSQGYTGRMAAGHLDGDGHLDLVALATTFPPGATSPRVLLGSATGSLTAASNLTGLTFPNSVALGDLDGDGALDLVVAETGRPGAAVFLGDGQGGLAFLGGVASGGGTAPASAILLDLDADHILDLALINTNPDGLEVLRGAGNGTFTPVAVYPPAGFHPNRLAAGDVDGDGAADLVTVDAESGALSVFRGKGDGALEAPVPIPLPQGLIPGLVLLDLDGDGQSEISFIVDSGAAKPGTMGVIRDPLR